jgi:hypothetical protein
MAEAIFWMALACTAYVCVGYPLLLLSWQWWQGQPVRKRYHEASVSLGIAMHNERNQVQPPYGAKEKYMGTRVRKLLLTPISFDSMNRAAVTGLYYFTRGSRDLWSPAGARHS